MTNFVTTMDSSTAIQCPACGQRINPDLATFTCTSRIFAPGYSACYAAIRQHQAGRGPAVRGSSV